VTEIIDGKFTALQQNMMSNLDVKSVSEFMPFLLQMHQMMQGDGK
jgi:hypothetical protein